MEQSGYEANPSSGSLKIQQEQHRQLKVQGLKLIQTGAITSVVMKVDTIEKSILVVLIGDSIAE